MQLLHFIIKYKVLFLRKLMEMMILWCLEWIVYLMKQHNKYLRTNQISNWQQTPSGEDFMCLALLYLLYIGTV